MKFQEFLKDMGFDVNKYQALDNLDDYNLVTQLKVREGLTPFVKALTMEDINCFKAYFLEDSFFEMADRGELSSEQIRNYVNTRGLEYFSSLIKYYKMCFSNPIVAECDFFKADTIHFERRNVYSGHVPYMLSYSDTVRPLSRYSLEFFLFDHPSRGVGVDRILMLTPDEIADIDEEDADKLYIFSNESVSAICPESMDKARNGEDFGYSMYLSVDIKKTDEEILQDIERLLPIWRRELSIDPPEKKRSWEYIRNKILSYRIIALMDLQEIAGIYMFLTKKRVPKRLLSLALYPEGERDGFGLDQTVIPFLEKIRGKSYKLLDEYKINKK